jgi:hypothetical protein
MVTKTRNRLCLALKLQQDSLLPGFLLQHLQHEKKKKD